MNGLKLYFRYIGILLKSTMQYKLSFFLSCLGQFLLTCNSVFALYFLFARFQSIKGFSFAEVIFCYSIMQLSFAITESYARGFDSFSSLIINGDFDRLLLRPRRLTLQVLGSKFEFSRIGRLIIAVIIFLRFKIRKYRLVVFKGSDHFLYALRRHGSIFRTLFNLCSYFFFYNTES